MEYLSTQIKFDKTRGKMAFEPTNPDVFLQTVLEYRASAVYALKDITQIR